uniref:Uncharacterized protein n=1 Tax=Arundo donax TaxID=35708 RepID=A0A0A9DDB6_ARUDO
MKQQQSKAIPSNGRNHLIPEDTTLNCVSPSKSSDDLLPQDSESNESLHKMDIKDRESDLDLHISNGDKFISNENLHLSVSPVLHVLEDTGAPDSPLEGSTSMRSVQIGPPFEDVPTTMSSVQFGNSTSEASSVHSFAEQCKEPASCIDSVDYMDIDTEGCEEVERLNEQSPVLDDLIGRTDYKASVPTFANGTAGKPKPLFSPGFLDKPSRKRSTFAEEGHIDGDSAGSSHKLNGHCNGHLSNSEQVAVPNSCGGCTSSGSEKCNGDMFAASSSGDYHAVNGDAQSNGSLHAEKRDVPYVSHGFKPRPYREPSGSNTSSGKPSKAFQGDMSFLHRGFLERPCSRGKSIKVDDGFPLSNGTSSSFVNGKSKSNNNSSSQSGLSPGFLTRHSRESAVISTSASSMHGLKTSSNISMEQRSNGAGVVPNDIEERWSSDCTTNGSSFQLQSASDDKVSDHLSENGHAILATKNTNCGQESGGNGTPDVNAVGCQRDDAPAMLVSEKSLGSEHDGLRRRVTSKFFEQNGIDAQ